MNINIKELEYPSYSLGSSPRVSWRAIWAGALVSLALSLCFGLLGVGVGAIHVPITGTVAAFTGGAIAWTIISGMIAFFIGGWTGSRLAGAGLISDSVLHGLSSWALATVGAVALLPFVGFLFVPAVMRFSPAVAGTVGWAGFLLTALECISTCSGALLGARILRPVPVEQYHRGQRRETVGTVGTGTVGTLR